MILHICTIILAYGSMDNSLVDDRSIGLPMLRFSKKCQEETSFGKIFIKIM